MHLRALERDLLRVLTNWLRLYVCLYVCHYYSYSEGTFFCDLSLYSDVCNIRLKKREQNLYDVYVNSVLMSGLIFQVN